jgi:hypothetical protein
MTIPESQLETWSHQGSITQSSTTYATIRTALQSASTKYAGKDFGIFLQGSYGNDTNIYAESDVDVVIRLDSTFHYDLAALTDADRATFEAAYSGSASYSYGNFKGHVLDALNSSFGASVSAGPKAIKITANGSRRNADVVAATQFRLYTRFKSTSDQTFHDGICFFTSAGNRIVNYPKQHSANCSAKHQATGNNFKPLVRIFKNIRSKLVGDGLIGNGVAPSYFIEGLLYNVPNDKFSGTYANMVCNILTWLHATPDRHAPFGRKAAQKRGCELNSRTPKANNAPYAEPPPQRTPGPDICL